VLTLANQRWSSWSFRSYVLGGLHGCNASNSIIVRRWPSSHVLVVLDTFSCFPRYHYLSNLSPGAVLIQLFARLLDLMGLVEEWAKVWCPVTMPAVIGLWVCHTQNGCVSAEKMRHMRQARRTGHSTQRDKDICRGVGGVINSRPSESRGARSLASKQPTCPTAAGSHMTSSWNDHPLFGHPRQHR